MDSLDFVSTWGPLSSPSFTFNFKFLISFVQTNSWYHALAYFLEKHNCHFFILIMFILSSSNLNISLQ